MRQKIQFYNHSTNFHSTMRLMKLKNMNMGFEGINKSTGTELDEL